MRNDVQGSLSQSQSDEELLYFWIEVRKNTYVILSSSLLSDESGNPSEDFNKLKENKRQTVSPYMSILRATRVRKKIRASEYSDSLDETDSEYKKLAAMAESS